MNTTSLTPRTGGQILVQQLITHGVKQLFCVPGESYLAVLDALHDADIGVTVCRQEVGAAMMAEAQGKLTGRPGICMVTRGPGATNASAGLHVAMQDSTPMILFVGQIERSARDREAFQELNYRAVFGPMVKWATEIDDAARVPETVSYTHLDVYKRQLLHDAGGLLQGCASWLPIHREGRLIGWTLDFMRRRPHGFRHTMEALIGQAALDLQAEGFEELSLSGAPLALSLIHI